MLRLAMKAFHPGKLPFPAAAHRHDLEVPADDRVPGSLLSPTTGSTFIVHTNRRRRRADGMNPFDYGSKYTDDDEDQGLLQALGEGRLRRGVRRCARRDEEASRAKERIYSFRDERRRQWDPKNQRPELWSLYNGKINKGESIRVFPLVQLDRARHLAVHLPRSRSRSCRCTSRPKRPVVDRDGARSSWSTTSGCDSRTASSRGWSGALPHAGLLPAHRAAIRSDATTLPEIIARCCSSDATRSAVGA